MIGFDHMVSIAPAVKLRIAQTCPVVCQDFAVSGPRSGGLFPAHLLFCYRQPGAHPQVMGEHRPGHAALTMEEPFASYRLSEKAVLEDVSDISKITFFEEIRHERIHTRDLRGKPRSLDRVFQEENKP